MKDLILLAKGNSRKWVNFDGSEVWGVNDVSVFPEFKGKKVDRTFTFDPRSPEWLTKVKETGSEIWSWQPFADKRYPLQEVIEFFGTKYFTNTISYMLALAIYEGFERIRLYGVDAPYGGIYFMEKSGLEYWIGRAQQKGIEVVPCQESLMLQTYDGLLYGERGSTSIDLYLSDRNYLMNLLPKEGDFDTMYLSNLAAWLLAVKVTERDEHDIKVGQDGHGNILYQAKNEFLSRIHFPYWVLNWFRQILKNIELQRKLPRNMVSIYGILCKLNQPEPVNEWKKGSRVSYILATKNRANWLGKTFENIKELKKVEDEFIVIDGNSTDGTKELIKEYSNLIDKYITEDDLNTAHALNKGILISTGKYIRQICDDDSLNPLESERAIKYMEYNDLDLLVCGGVKQQGTQKMVITAPETYGQKVEDVFKYGGCGAGTIYKRDAFARFGLMDTTIVPIDREYVMRVIAQGGKVKFLNGQFYYHAVFPHSTSIVNLDKWNIDNNNLIKKYCPQLVKDVN